MRICYEEAKENLMNCNHKELQIEAQRFELENYMELNKTDLIKLILNETY
jgi:hypothetical protein